MIVFVHIPKTAGTSFRADLGRVAGLRILDDYDDWTESATPEALAHNARRRGEMLAAADAIAGDYDAISGHVTARKYLGVFASTQLVTFVRDPYQQAVSTYAHALRQSDLDHPGFLEFKRRAMTLVEFIEAFPNHQSLYVDGLPLDAFAMIGVTEEYDRSVRLFAAVTGLAMPHGSAPDNVNPLQPFGARYDIAPDVRAAVDRFRSDDVTLYARARERFQRDCALRGL